MIPPYPNACPPVECHSSLSAGPPGRNGEDGRPGDPGASSFGTLTAAFPVPAAGGVVSISVSDTSWIGVGGILLISGAGYWSVLTVESPSSIRVSPFRDTPAQGTTVSASRTVSLAGPPGPAGQDGALTGVAGGDLAGNYPNPTIRNIPGLAAGAYAKVTVNAKGQVVSGTGLVASDIPVMAGDVGSGGIRGAVPAPPAGASAGRKFLLADGTFSPILVPTSSIKTANYNATLDDRVILVNATSGDLAVYLPSVSAARGLAVTVKRVDNAPGSTVNVHPATATERIDRASQVQLYSGESSLTVVSDGSVWRIAASHNLVKPRCSVIFQETEYAGDQGPVILGPTGSVTVEWNETGAYSEAGNLSRFTPGPSGEGKFLVLARATVTGDEGAKASLAIYRNNVLFRTISPVQEIEQPDQSLELVGAPVMISLSSADFFDVRLVPDSPTPISASGGLQCDYLSAL